MQTQQIKTKYSDYLDNLEYTRKNFISSGYMFGESAINVERYYDRDETFAYFNPSSFHQGDLLFIDDDDKNVFYNPETQKAYLLAARKLEDKIRPVKISLEIFDNLIFESKKDSLTREYINAEYKDRAEYESHMRETFPEGVDWPDHLFELGMKPCFPFTNQFHDVYDVVKGSHTYLEIWNKLKGRCLKVVKTTEVLVAVMEGGYAYGKIRADKIVVPVFTFVEEYSKYIDNVGIEINPEQYYNPEDFNDELRIVMDSRTKKNGIYNLAKKRMVANCEFDHISYCNFYNPKYVHSKTCLIKMKLGKYEAMLKFDDLKNVKRINQLPY